MTSIKIKLTQNSGRLANRIIRGKPIPRNANVMRQIIYALDPDMEKHKGSLVRFSDKTLALLSGDTGTNTPDSIVSRIKQNMILSGVDSIEASIETNKLINKIREHTQNEKVIVSTLQTVEKTLNTSLLNRASPGVAAAPVAAKPSVTQTIADAFAKTPSKGKPKTPSHSTVSAAAILDAAAAEDIVDPMNIASLFDPGRKKIDVTEIMATYKGNYKFGPGGVPLNAEKLAIIDEYVKKGIVNPNHEKGKVMSIYKKYSEDERRKYVAELQKKGIYYGSE